ncbi:MAG: zf-HC2 domain-containing protein [Candidatus Sabulitectum sp.]|nr:zf-HC2 domain-containing protein [Candidatus Sabulitectum sp.]
MKCKEALLLMDSVLDGEATPEDEQLLGFHINGCPSCRKIMSFNESITEQLKRIEEPEPPSDLMEMVRKRLYSGDYVQSPLENKNKKKNGSRFRISAWTRFAAVIPFAAALVLILHNFNGEDSSSYGNGSFEAVHIEKAETRYAPVPIVAYSRPSSVSTF